MKVGVDVKLNTFVAPVLYCDLLVKPWMEKYKANSGLMFATF